MIKNVFITACLRMDFLPRMIESLYEYTPHNFKLIVVDETLDGIEGNIDTSKIDLILRPRRNLGFAKSMNEGIIHALHWKSEYVTCWNDDAEMINNKWWDGIMETFEMPSQKEILMVAPESPRIPLWGYGDTKGNYVEVISLDEAKTEEGYQYLLKGDFSDLPKKYPDLPKSFPLNYTGVCDALAAWGPVCKSKLFKEIGLWDERFYPGAGEDYDMMGRIYSKGYRAVSTRKSWAWHHWGKSKDSKADIAKTGLPIEPERDWNRLGDIWKKEDNEGNSLDVWGMYTSKDGKRKPFKREAEIAVVDI